MTRPTRSRFAFSMKREIRHDEIDARQVVAREGDAEIDHQPLAIARRPEAIERAIHADFAEAAERREHELRCRRSSRIGLSSAAPRAASASAVIRKMSAASIVSTTPSRFSLRRPRSSRPSNTPSRAPRARWRRGSACRGRRRPRARRRESERKAGAARPGRERFARSGTPACRTARSPSAAGREWPRARSSDRQALLASDETLTPMPTIAARRRAGRRYAIDQQARELGAVVDEVVRPFELGAATPTSATARCASDAGDKAELCRDRGLAGVDEQRARIEVAGRRDPVPPLPAAPCGLRVGDDPEPARVAGERALPRVIACASRASHNARPAIRSRVFAAGSDSESSRSQNSDLAAAMAALVMGAGDTA